MVGAEGAVRAPLDLEPEGRVQLSASLGLGAAVLHVDSLVLRGAIEALEKDVILGSSPAVYRGHHPTGPQLLGEAGRGEVAYLIGVEELPNSLFGNRPVNRRQAEACVQDI
jgi:hypothetical protein